MIAVPDKLKEIQAYFSGRDFRREELGKYNRSSWEKHFGSDPDCQACIERNPEAISRQCFADIEMNGKDNMSAIRQIFFTTMIWGYGVVGYGPFRTNEMLSTNGADEQIRSTYEAVRCGKIADAYRSLKLYKCGPAYISKFLYAVGLSIKAHPMPLILDSIVARSMNCLLTQQGENYQQFFKLQGSGMVSFYPEGYERYVVTLNQWADQLGVPPDAIELYLFEGNY